jgi:hypothetical protein
MERSVHPTLASRSLHLLPLSAMVAPPKRRQGQPPCAAVMWSVYDCTSAAGEPEKPQASPGSGTAARARPGVVVAAVVRRRGGAALDGVRAWDAGRVHQPVNAPFPPPANESFGCTWSTSVCVCRTLE